MPSQQPPRSNNDRNLIVHPNPPAPETRTAFSIGSYRLAFTFLAAVPVIALLGYFAIQMRTSSVLERMEREAELSERKANAELTLSATRQAMIAEAEAKAVSKSKFDTLLRRFATAHTNLEQLELQQDALRTEQDAFFQGDDGKRAASNEEITRDAEAYWISMQDSKQTDTALLQAQLDELQSPILQFQSEIPSDFTPSVPLVMALAEIETEASNESNRVSLLLDRIKQLSRRAAQYPPAGNASLLSIINDRRQQSLASEHREHADRLAKARLENEQRMTQAKIDHERELAQVKLDGERRIAEQEQEKLRLEKEAMAAGLSQGNLKVSKELAEAKLQSEFEADKPEIRRLLSAYLSHGNSLRGNDPAGGPASLAVLQSKGVTAPGRRGVEAICYVAFSAQDRESGPLPLMFGNEQSYQAADKTEAIIARDFLVKYGQLMVDDKMLSP